MIWQYCQPLQVHVFSRTVENTDPSDDCALRLICGSGCEYILFFRVGTRQHTRSMIATARFSEQLDCLSCSITTEVSCYFTCMWVLLWFIICILMHSLLKNKGSDFYHLLFNARITKSLRKWLYFASKQEYNYSEYIFKRCILIGVLICPL